ncbi:hypothetical protein K439DRAFT_898768 [Ramaria rubella]|nr:hypothetical protein K439DRAFT_898768 [Ramaria rubella]
MPSHSSCQSATLTLLPDLLALVHIPRSRLNYFSHQVVKQILTPAPSFLNITCNKLELTLFAHHAILVEFEPLARKDRQRLRKSATFRRPITQRQYDPVEVSYDTWNVLQLDTHDDRLDNAGARVRELSAPLAEAGISILYQSSYMSDFIFVKSSRLTQVLYRLAQAGFVGYSFDITSRLSPILSPTDADDLHRYTSSDDPVCRNAVRRSIDGATMELIIQRDELPIPAHTVSPSSTATATPISPDPPRRSSSASPCASDVQILDQDIVCVGLSDACAETWASKIIKLVLYPELIATATTSKPPLDFFETTDPTLSPLDEPGIHPRFDVKAPPSFDTWPSSPSASDSSSLPTSPASSSEDGYFSSASPYSPSPSGSPPSLASCSRSFPELNGVSSAFSKVHARSRPRLPRLNTTSVASSAPTDDSRQKAVPFFSFTRTNEGSSLTTGVGLISTLFPPNERHMLICSDELGTEDVVVEDGWGSGTPQSITAPSMCSRMKCLQIDLQRFGLDKHGLISRFSKVLDSNGINHMYSSTYKTANLLVNKGDAVRAQALLKSC